ncbi:TetR/AcrR family transcriptional regulator [Ralstonia wenshanensis]|uniref:TetR/AcrR family transcriptional regulator n=1 Tax=Ralstonia wenshanensis TaxID=2842456 RepID=UPI0039C65A5A
MKPTSNSRKKETHERIVDVAAHAIRGRGYAGVSVAKVMKQAGFTHGGFYSHFESRDALLIEALDCASQDIAAEAARVTRQRAGTGASEFRCLVEAYLADQYLGALENGCPIAALAAEMPRQSQTVREASMVRVHQLIAAVRSALPASHRAMASTVTGSLVGALQLARALGDNPKGREVLSAARESLLQLYDTPVVTAAH